jgi:hypothetical protein
MVAAILSDRPRVEASTRLTPFKQIEQRGARLPPTVTIPHHKMACVRVYKTRQTRQLFRLSYIVRRA